MLGWALVKRGSPTAAGLHKEGPNRRLSSPSASRQTCVQCNQTTRANAVAMTKALAKINVDLTA